MKIDLSQFSDFLSNLSQVSHLIFEVWNGDELIFSSASSCEKVPIILETRDFSAQIAKLAAFQYAPGAYNSELFGVPLKMKGEVVGSLIAYGQNAAAASQRNRSSSGKGIRAEEMRAFLTNLARLVEERLASQGEIEDMANELSQSFEDLYLYSKIAGQIRSLQVCDSMLAGLTEQLLETMRVDLAFAKLHDREGYRALAYTDKLAGKIPELNSFVQGLLEAIPSEVFSLEDSYFAVANSTMTPGYQGLSTDPFRFLAVSVQHAGTFYGWLGLVSFNLKEVFRRSELKLLVSIAEQISMLITNTNLYRDLEQFVINVVKSLVQAIEAKDVYTRGHAERVSRYCSLMAEKINLSGEERVYLQWASILHDIGKIGISERILNKPAALTSEEYRIIKEHPQKGREILKPLDQLTGSLPGILHHHERFDGQGYPDGLKGLGIPRVARIIAVADTFDAITSERPYRAAKTPEEALAIIEEVAGSQLDPDLVMVFREVMSENPRLGVECDHCKESYRHAVSENWRSESWFQDHFDA
jgi:hypothetical protein